MQVDSSLGEGQAVPEAAPNLRALLGTDVAEKLIATAGGLKELASISACNIKLLGAREEKLAGSSTSFPLGHIGQTEIFQSTPPGSK